jgi:hypothetical protein
MLKVSLKRESYLKCNAHGIYHTIYKCGTNLDHFRILAYVPNEPQGDGNKVCFHMREEVV